MIKNKLESLKSGKFAAFKVSQFAKDYAGLATGTGAGTQSHGDTTTGIVVSSWTSDEITADGKTKHHDLKCDSGCLTISPGSSLINFYL